MIISKRQKISQGWYLDINVIRYLNILSKEEGEWFDDTLIYSAVNQQRSLFLSVYHESPEIGYRFEKYIPHCRKFGRFDFDSLENEYTIFTSLFIKDILIELDKYLNSENLPLVELDIYGGWKICKNNLLDNIQDYKDAEFLFFATNEKLFIDISYIKKDVKPFKIFLGQSRYPLAGFVLVVEKVQNSLSFEFENMNEVVDLIEKFVDKSINPPIDWNIF